MKKTMICTAAILLACAGCSDKSSSAVSSSASTGPVPVSAAGFTENQAETLMTSVISNHCASAGIACEVTAVSISGDDVIANYQYTKGGETVDASAVLSDVMVNAENPNEVTYSSVKFDDGAADIKEAAPDEEKDDEAEDTENKDSETSDDKKNDTSSVKLEHFDLTNEAPDLNEAGATDTVTVLTDAGLRVYRIYVTRENFVCEGTYDGNGTFNVIIMDLDQNIETVAVTQKESGDFSSTVPISEGFHYMVLKTDDGGWSFSWSALPDDMISHN